MTGDLTTPAVLVSKSGDSSVWMKVFYNADNTRGLWDSASQKSIVSTNDGVTCTCDMNFIAPSVEGAVFNDYAEYREADTIQGGRCVREVGDARLLYDLQQRWKTFPHFFSYATL